MVIEYQAVLAGSVLALFGMARVWGLTAPLGAARRGGGGRCMVALLPLLGYNIVAFGTPFRVGYSGVVGFEGMNRGLFGLGWPDPHVFAALLVGTRRGLLWVAPVLVPAVIGLLRLPQRAVARTCGGAVLVVLLVNAAYFYWDGGNATGPRHSMPALGLLALGLAPFWAGLKTQAARLAAGALLVLSVAVNLLIAACDVFAPPTDDWPLRWVWAQHFRPGDITSVAGDWWGWPEWTGLLIWATVALPMLGWLAQAAALHRSGPRVSQLGLA